MFYKIIFKYSTFLMLSVFCTTILLLLSCESISRINETGDLDYNIAGGFHDGLAMVQGKENLDYGFIDKTGKIVIETKYRYLDHFSEGFALYSEFNKEKKKYNFGYLNIIGKEVIPANYDDAKSFSEGLAAVKINDKYGYIDTSGNIVIEPAFDNAYNFSEGLAKLEIKGKVGFMNKSGNIIVKPEYFKAGSFKDGVAYLCNNFKCGYIDKSGKVLIELKFDDAKSFSEGLAPVRIKNKWKFINIRGNFAFDKKFDSADSYSEGLAQVGEIKTYSYDCKFGGFTDQGGRMTYGYIDKRGQFVIEPKFQNAEAFKNNLALVSIPGRCFTGDCDDYIFINKQEKEVVKRFNYGNSFENGVTFIKRNSLSAFIDTKGKYLLTFDSSFFSVPNKFKSSKYGFIDESGKTIINNKYVIADSFSEGRAYVEGVKYGQKKFINKKDETVIQLPKKALRIQPFSEGMAAIQLYDKNIEDYGYIDKTGNFVIAPQYDDAKPFSEGLAPVRLKNKSYISNSWQYIDKNGKVAFNRTFNDAEPFWGEVAFVVEAEKQTTGSAYLYNLFINKQGKTIVNTHKDKIYPLISQSSFGADKYSIYNNNLINKVNNTISFKEGLIPAIPGGKNFGYMNSSGVFVIKPKFDSAKAFQENLAPVKIGNKWGYIDKSGEIVIKPVFDDAQPFSNGAAMVKIYGKYGYINHSGEIIIEPQFFEEALPFSQERAIIKLNNLYGFIDKKGHMIIYPQYNVAKSFSEGLAAVAK